MRDKATRGIFGHFFLRSATIQVIAGLLLLAFLSFFFDRTTDELAAEQGLTVANSTLAATTDAIFTEDYPAIVDYCLNVMKATPNILSIVFSNRNGEELIVNGTHWSVTNKSLPYYRLNFQSADQVASRYAMDYKGYGLGFADSFNFSRPIFIAAKEWGVLTISFSTEAQRSSVLAFYGVVTVFVLGGIIFVLSLFYLSSRRIRHDLGSFEEVARSLSDGNTKVRAEESAVGEIGVLAKAVNKMSDSLKEKSSRIVQLANVVEQTNDAFVLFDRSRHVIFANEALSELTGYSSTHFVGMALEEFVSSRYLGLPDLLHEFDLAETGHERPPSHDVVLVRAKQDKINLEVRLEYIANEEGAFDGCLIVLSNITERKQAEISRQQLEAQLRESQKMEALGTLAGGIAHDFNNALAAITGNVALARQDVGPGHLALESLEEIDKASRRAKDLVQQILAFGRRQKLERKVMSLALVVVESSRLVRATLPALVSLSVDCQADTPAVQADATQVKQILLNLCTNALQAVQDMQRPGIIEIRLEACDRAWNDAQGEPRSGRYACLTVRDNGRGMDEATRLRIFEPFFSTKPRGKGTGLGLSVVHGIVQSHEASIEVESTPGIGSTFRIYFPAVEAQIPEVAETIPDAAPVGGKGKHVLYVDDEEAIIFLMTRLLERRGFRVSGYTDPREAIAAARANPDQYDLAVTDYNMPGMSGLDVAYALKEIRPDLPVVLASGFITEELRAKAPAAGIRELIYKPNTVEDLCEAVARQAQTVGKNSTSS